MFTLMHEDYQVDSIPVGIGTDHFHVHVLCPVDLAVSKIARLVDSDKEDIEALARSGLLTAEAVDKRAREALTGYIGDRQRVERNICDAVAIVRTGEIERSRGSTVTAQPSRRHRNLRARRGRD